MTRRRKSLPMILLIFWKRRACRPVRSGRNLGVLGGVKPYSARRVARHRMGRGGQIMDCSHFVILLARTQAAMQTNYQEKIWGGVHGMSPETVEMMQKFFKQFAENRFCHCR